MLNEAAVRKICEVDEDMAADEVSWLVPLLLLANSDRPISLFWFIMASLACNDEFEEADEEDKDVGEVE